MAEEIQNNATGSITREQLDNGITVILATRMVEQAAKFRAIGAAINGSVVLGRSVYIAALVTYMLARQHFEGAILVAFICLAYDEMQKALCKQDYNILAATACGVIGAAALYICMGGEAMHLCGVVFGMFAFRYVQMQATPFYVDANDILTAKDILIENGIGDSTVLLVTTNNDKEYRYEWDEDQIREYMEGGGELPDPAAVQKQLGV